MRLDRRSLEEIKRATNILQRDTRLLAHRKRPGRVRREATVSAVSVRRGSRVKA